MLQPHLLVGRGDVAPSVILTGDPKRVPILAELLDRCRKVAEFRQYVTFTGTYREVPVSVASTGIGAPATAIAVEELVKAGARTLIRVGTTGALQPAIALGDLVIATGAARYDGASRAYAPLELPAVADHRIVSALIGKARELGLPFHVGLVWTSDAFYSEAGTTLETLSRLGVKSVEMECSVLFLLGQLRSLRCGAVLAVDGNLATGKKKGEIPAGGQPIEFSNAVLGALKNATKVALEALLHLHREG